MKCAPTWTLDELSSDLTSLQEQEVWRMVEGQHLVATLSIVDDLEDQALLEEILEDFKPPLPEEVEGLPFLLATPFRYASAPGTSPHDSGSRFRRAGLTDGVFYCAKIPETCAYETGSYRARRFYAESVGLEYQASGITLSAFSTTITSDKVLDLTTHRTLSAYADAWEDPDSYLECQRLADDARKAGVEVIAYRSVRDPEGGLNYAVLTPAAFHSRSIGGQQTWICVLSHAAVYMRCECPSKTLAIYTDV